MQVKDEMLDIVKEYIKSNQNEFYRLAYSYTRNEDDALDVIQEAVYKAMTNASKLKKPEFIKTWMYRIVVNESINIIKKQNRRIFDNLEDVDIPYVDKDITTSISLQNAINKLPLKQKTVIILRFFEDMMIEEIAIVTKTNVSTVKTRLYKALSNLKKEI